MSQGCDGKDAGYLNYLRVARNYKAVTAHFILLTTRKLFKEIGGFDESNLAVAYNDVDFCYRVIELANKRCVYCPDAQLIHKEGSSRDFGMTIMKYFYFKEKYGDKRDPFFSPNFSSENGKFGIVPYCLPLQFHSKVKVLAITHNLNYLGSPLEHDGNDYGAGQDGKNQAKDCITEGRSFTRSLRSLGHFSPGSLIKLRLIALQGNITFTNFG